MNGSALLSRIAYEGQREPQFDRGGFCMKKEFIEPEVEVIEFEVEEQIAGSSDGFADADGDGWSDGWK